MASHSGTILRMRGTCQLSRLFLITNGRSCSQGCRNQKTKEVARVGLKDCSQVWGCDYGKRLCDRVRTVCRA